MKYLFSFILSACLFFTMSVGHADVAKTLESYEHFSKPEIEALLDEAMPILNSRRCRGGFRSYLRESKKAKAFAYTVKPNGKGWFCRESRQKTQALADRKAVEICNKRRKKSLPSCKLFASHNTLKVNPKDFKIESNPDDLFYAVDRLSLSAITKLVESGADIHQINKEGDTPFLLATRSGRIDVMDYLLKKGADINHKDKLGYDALNFAAKSDLFKLFEFVLSHGADIKTVDKQQRQPIHYAAQSRFGELRIIDLILSKGGDINALDMRKRTALHYASKRRRFTPLKFLIKKGANVNIKDISGKTPLDIAGDGRIMKYLIKHGAKSGDEI